MSSKDCLLCDKPVLAKGYCTLHYSRLYASGTAYVNRVDNPNWKNLGKKCSTDKCQNEAIALTLCHRHYVRHKRGRPPEQTFINKGRTCLETNCDLAACTRGLCSSHYYKQRRRSKKLKELGIFHHNCG